jgi:F-type H+-transporting ATPase subunit a
MGGTLLAQESTEHAAEKDITAHSGEAHGPEKFRAGDMIMEHILDAHDWHIMTIGDHHISIPLPVILYSPSKGLSAFMSSRFEHGHASYEGYRLEKGGIVSEDGSEFYDLSITKNTASMLVSMIILAFIFISVANAYRRNPAKAPKGLQSLLEPIIIFIRDEVAKPAIGPKYMKYLPYLLTVFFFIWINNLMGLIPIAPFGANVTGNIAVTLTLATITFLITLFSGNKHYWRHIFAMPGVPSWVLLLLTPIEILGIFLRPFVLMIRLFANIAAGHIIALSFFSLIFIFAEINTGLGLGVSVVSVAFTVFMGCLELLVAFLQAYVFTLLSAIYFGAAVEEHHHEEHHHEEEKAAVPVH